MKKLISLISTEGKTAEQISSEAKLAWEKYQNANKKLKELNRDDKK